METYIIIFSVLDNALEVLFPVSSALTSTRDKGFIPLIACPGTVGDILLGVEWHPDFDILC